MISDLVERAWWGFRMPECIVWSPGNTEDDARKTLAKNHAPEIRGRAFFYPLIGSRFTSRAALHGH